MIPESTQHWKALSRLATARQDSNAPAAELTPLILEAAGLHADLSKQQLDAEVIAALIDLAQEIDLAGAIEAQFSGANINQSEGRPALHTALRAPLKDVPEVARAAAATMTDILDLADAVRSGGWRGAADDAITDVVHIGIGGSHLGPELAVEALSNEASGGPRIHFVANIDGHALQSAINGLNPERTLFVIVSKSFSTLETRVNAQSARAWFLERMGSLESIAKHFVAISTNLAAADDFGIPQANVYPMWDWVGGRYSV